jgi:peroxiredoxin Q/BCP
MTRLKEVLVANPKLVALASVVLLAAAAFAYAQGGSETELKAGDPAPAFSLPGSDGKTHSLADLKGKTVVLAWFPKAFTGG